MKITVTRNVNDNVAIIKGTAEQEEVRALEYEVKHQIAKMLAEQYISVHGREILDAISPELIANELKDHISRAFWGKA